MKVCIWSKNSFFSVRMVDNMPGLDVSERNTCIHVHTECVFARNAFRILECQPGR